MIHDVKGVCNQHKCFCFAGGYLVIPEVDIMLISRCSFGKIAAQIVNEKPKAVAGTITGWMVFSSGLNTNGSVLCEPFVHKMKACSYRE